jgi:hypothetical protein
MPVAFLSFAGVYSLLLARWATSARTATKYVFLGAAICAGAALTKQAGLFIAGIYPLLAWLLVYRRAAATNESGPFSDAILPRRRLLLHMTLLTLLLIATITPWYGYKQIAIWQGNEHTLTAYLLHDIHAGRNLWQRLLFAGGMLCDAISLPALVVLLLAMCFSMRDSVQRWLVLLVAGPFSLLWALGFSYDLRNVSLAVPFVGMAAGIGIAELGQMIARVPLAMPVLAFVGRRHIHWHTFPIVRSLPLGYVVALLAVPLLLLGSQVSRDDLIARHRRLQEHIGMSDVNEHLYEYQRRQGIEGLIATDYLAMPWLPELSEHGLRCTADTLESFRLVYDKADVKYALLYKGHTCPQVQQYLATAGGPGDSQLLFDLSVYRLYKKTERR